MIVKNNIKKLIIFTFSFVFFIVFTFVPVSAYSGEVYNFRCSQPQISSSSCFIEIVPNNQSSIPLILYVACSNYSLTEIQPNSLSFKAHIDTNSNRLVISNVNGNTFTSGDTLYVLKLVGYCCSADGDCYSLGITSDMMYLSLANIGGIKGIRGYNCDVSSLSYSARTFDFVFAYGYDNVLNDKLDILIESYSGSTQQIIDNADRNADKIRDEIRGDDQTTPEYDDSAISDYDNAERNALGGKSDSQIQAEIGSALSGTDEIDWTKANRISNFFDGLLNAFGNDYKSLVLLSLTLGLAAFLIGRRYG